MIGKRFSHTTGPIGIEFAASGVRMIQLREQAGALHVVGAARLTESMEEYDGWSAEDAAQRLRRTLGSGFSGRRCLISLPRTDLRTQSVRLPSMSDGDLRQAIEWEASQRFELDREAMEVDFIRTGAILQTQEGRDEVLIVAVGHDAILPRLEPILLAGLRPDAIEPGFCAVARFFSRRCRRESDRDIVRVIAEVGATGSTVLITRGDQVAFLKPLQISGRDLDRAVMEHLQLDAAAAHDIRAARIAASARNRSEGPDRETIDRPVFESVRPLLCDLVKEIVLCLRYYGVTFRGHPPQQVILAGSDGREPHLASLLEQACELPVLLDDEAGTLADLEPLLCERVGASQMGTAAAWTVASGLSMRGLAASCVELESPGSRRRQEAA